MKYFQEAIRIGTYEYQNSDASDRGQYIKQLANRVGYLCILLFARTFISLSVLLRLTIVWISLTSFGLLVL